MLSEGRDRYGSLTDSAQLRFLQLPQIQTLFPGECVPLVNGEHCAGLHGGVPSSTQHSVPALRVSPVPI